MRNTAEESKELLITLMRIYSHWVLESLSNPEKCSTRTPELFEKSFICKVLDKRLEAFSIDVKVPDYLILIIELCTEGNPGQSLMILSEILENIPHLKSGHIIEPMDFARVYKDKFPVVRVYPEMNSRLQDRWSSQKITPRESLDSDNQCDYPEYWTKFFE